MFTIKEENINLTLPFGDIGIVAMQPFIELTSTPPYHWSSSRKSQQIDRVIKTLEIAQSADHRCGKTHFTLFPESAIPGLEGVIKIEEVLNDNTWKEGTIVLGGIDGLNKTEYSRLYEDNQSQFNDKNNPNEVKDYEWINCSITWLKTSNNKGESKLTRWIQPKLCASWPEQEGDYTYMFPGKRVYLFKAITENGTAFRFFSLICFDWIGSFMSGKGISEILKRLNTKWNNSEDAKPIHLVFILQNNNKPNNPNFLSNAYNFFYDVHPFIDRDKCTILFINSAGSTNPGLCSSHGFTSLVFSSQAPYCSTGSPASYAVNTKNLRKTDSQLISCKEALFRENGQCAHSFAFKNPAALYRISTDQRRPLYLVSVHAIDQGTKDPRLPNSQVPAIIKWTNDTLEKLPQIHGYASNVVALINNKKNYISNEIKWCKACRLTRMFILGNVGKNEEECKKIDCWDEEEKRTLDTISTSLTLINCNHKLSIKDAPAHAYINENNTVIDIVVISGGKTHKENYDHVRNNYSFRRERKCLIISRDIIDRPLNDKEKYIYDTETQFNRCGFADLKDCLSKSTIEDLNQTVEKCIGKYNEH